MFATSNPRATTDMRIWPRYQLTRRRRVAHARSGGGYVITLRPVGGKSTNSRFHSVGAPVAEAFDSGKYRVTGGGRRTRQPPSNRSQNDEIRTYLLHHLLHRSSNDIQTVTSQLRLCESNPCHDEARG